MTTPPDPQQSNVQSDRPWDLDRRSRRSAPPGDVRDREVQIPELRTDEYVVLDRRDALIWSLVGAIVAIPVIALIVGLLFGLSGLGLAEVVTPFLLPLLVMTRALEKVFVKGECIVYRRRRRHR